MDHIVSLEQLVQEYVTNVYELFMFCQIEEYENKAIRQIDSRKTKTVLKKKTNKSTPRRRVEKSVAVQTQSDWFFPSSLCAALVQIISHYNAQKSRTTLPTP